MLNVITLIGRVVREIDLRLTNTGKAVANFTLAVDRSFKGPDGEKQTDFINIVIWGKQAESCAKYLGKGKSCAIKGALQMRSYETKDGQKRTIAEVVAEDVQFLSPRDGSEQARRAIEDDITLSDGMDINDDSLPF